MRRLPDTSLKMRRSQPKVEATDEATLYDDDMKLRQKIILFAVLPLVLALLAVASTVYYQATSLEQLQRESMGRTYKNIKDEELKNYITLAQQSIAHLYDSGRTDTSALNEAKAILASLNYGLDGYFFLFDLQGIMLMHSRQPELVGQYVWDITDTNGNPAIQKLASRALEGGGFEDYTWQKPSSGTTVPEPKRAYVVVLKNWGWVLGTGVYLDDIDVALTEIDKQASHNISRTMMWIIAISFLSVIAIFLGLMINIKERSLLDERLVAANAGLVKTNTELEESRQRIVNARERERERMKNDLHDGVQSMLVAAKLKIETGMQLLHTRAGEHVASAQPAFKSAAMLLKETLTELRKIIDDIYPAGDLVARLSKLCSDMSHDTFLVEFNVLGEIEGLSSATEKALDYVASEALHNISKHAKAYKASVHLAGTTSCIKLEILDDGIGFDKDLILNSPGRGIGLRNIEQRIESVGGQLTITSSSSGTCVVATVPLP